MSPLFFYCALILASFVLLLLLPAIKNRPWLKHQVQKVQSKGAEHD